MSFTKSDFFSVTLSFFLQFNFSAYSHEVFKIAIPAIIGVSGQLIIKYFEIKFFKFKNKNYEPRKVNKKGTD